MIGLLFGDTDFPKQILKKIKKNKIKYFIVDLSKNNFFKKDPHSISIGIGQLGKIFKALKKKSVKKFYLLAKLTNLNSHH